MTRSPLGAHTPAAGFIADYCDEHTGADMAARLAEIAEQVRRAGRWWPTFPELEWAARVAWRNADRCIGRFYWRGLTVRDSRHLTDPDDVATDLVDHLHQATNGGRIRAVVTVLNPAVTVLNDQLIGYAGYRIHGRLIGDPKHLGITRRALAAGWQPPDPNGPTDWDVLPLLLCDRAGRVTMHPLPAAAVLQVPITHPTYPGIGTLGLRWYAVPVITQMPLQLTADLSYGCAFGGWYMGAEIGARDLADVDRYNRLAAIADVLGLDRSSDRTLWRDAAVHALNVAVLESFRRANVRIADHYEASEHYLRFVEAEIRAGRPPTRTWAWLAGLSGTQVGVWRTDPFDDYRPSGLLPVYAHQEGRCPVTH